MTKEAKQKTQITKEICKQAQLMRKGGANQTEVAQLLGVNACTISRIEAAGFDFEKYTENRKERREKEKQKESMAQPAEEPPAPAEAKGPTQRELYRSLMDALYDAVLLVDDKGHVVDSSIRVEHVFGYTPGDMWDMSLSQLIKGFTPVIFTQLAQPLSENRPVIMSGRGVRKDGSLFDAEVSVSKVKLLRNDTMLFAVRDVTRRNESIKEKLMAQLQAKPAAAAAPASPPNKVLRCVRKVTPAK